MTELQLVEYLDNYNKIFVNGRVKLIKILVKRLKLGYITQKYYDETMLDVIKELNILSTQSSVFIRDFIFRNYIDGIRDTELILLKYKKLKLKSINNEELHKNAVEVLTNTLNNNINKSLEVIGKNIVTLVDRIVIDNSAKGLSLKSVKIAKELIKEELINNSILSITYRNGRKVPIESYASMAARSIIRESTNTAMINVMHSNNLDLVTLTSHYPTCPICSMYQGRVYTTDKYNKDYPYLYDTVFNHGYKNIHPNCKHVIIPYIDNLYDKSKIEKDKIKSNKDFEYDKNNDMLIKENEKYKEMIKEKRRLSEIYKNKQENKELKEL